MRMGRRAKFQILLAENRVLAENVTYDYYYALPYGRDKVPALQRHKKQQFPSPEQLTHYAPRLLPLAPLNDCNLQD
jgi:hypothetical protein